MDNNILQLYPLPGRELPLQGLYLNHDLRAFCARSAAPFFYANYVVSLDGRIAVPHPTRPGLVVPPNVANPRDWRLFQELAVQADIMITTGRYLRDYADGRAQEILRVHKDPQFADLKDWRLSQGLAPLPDLALISASLDFPIPKALTREDRDILIFTTADADADRVKNLEAQTGKVIVAGERRVGGSQLATVLAERGYRLIYNTAGPKVLHLLLAAGLLDRLYMTQTGRALGGSPFSSILEGDLLTPSRDFKLHSLYYDPIALEGLGQLFITYDRAPSSPTE